MASKTSVTGKKLRPTRHVQVSRGPYLRQVIPTPHGIVVHDRIHVALLHLESFEQLWRVKVPTDSVPAFVHGSIVAIGGSGAWLGLDLVDGRRMWGPSKVGYCIPWQDRILALQPVRLGYLPYRGITEVDLSTGEIVRVISESEDVSGSRAFTDDVVVGRNSRGDAVTVFDLRAERVLWKRDLIAEIRSRHNADTSIGCAAHGVFIAIQGPWLAPSGKTWRGGLVACSLADGTVLWEREMSVKGYPSIVGGRVYLLEVDSSTPACFHCLDLQTGESHYAVPQPLVHYLDHPYEAIVNQDELVFTTSRGLIMALRVEHGAVSWWCQYRETVTPPAFSGKYVLVPAFDGRLLVFDAPGQRVQGGP